MFWARRNRVGPDVAGPRSAISAAKFRFLSDLARTVRFAICPIAQLEDCARFG
jgi:hypothetical protein